MWDWDESGVVPLTFRWWPSVWIKFTYRHFVQL